MPSKSPRNPSYRLHKASGQDVVTLDGRELYLGAHGTDASKAAYDRVIADQLTNGRQLPSEELLSIEALVARYRHHIEGRYRSNEPSNIRNAIRTVRGLYGDTLAADFGPLALKVIRRRFVKAGHVRSQVNQKVRAIVRMFKWGVSEQLVPASTWEALRSVEGIRRGAADVREGRPVQPVPDAVVEATLPHVPRQEAAMIQLQPLTGARPGEISAMRTCDLTTTGKVWE